MNSVIKLFSSYLIIFKLASGGVIDLSDLNFNAFSLPSEATGNLVQNWNENSGQNPEELGEYAEGDILFPKLAGRNGLLAESSRWPNKTIPFVIDGTFNAMDMNMIESAIDKYHNKTCLRFVPKTTESDYLRITSENTGCWSSVGRTGGAQDLNLQSPGCLKKIGTVLHEFMHAVGFLHEQNRPERDHYVDIVWDNIKENHEHNFNKAKRNKVNDFGVGYDYRSVMHYSAKAFSRNGENTINSKDTAYELGQREGFSRSDIQKIQKMYDCKKHL